MVPVAVYVYKGQKRLRIQLRTHALNRTESEHVQDMLAAAMGVQIVARNVPETAEEAHDAHRPIADEEWVSEPIASTEPRDRAS
jgi:hypothetical protein